ncbi:type II toxin-antitoxin system antitoxin SocA domain-containing protein [Magnetovibrio sp. PR-2]|uniref:Panacea domain-containing protein n=1 Tax=Magnetovibrio sp. PR-2 TaxID=3120356 RepID=UPI002FCE6688
MSYDGRAIANFVLDYCEDNGHPITNLSLQKIVYFCHVWSLITLGRPLIRHQFEAWKYGPVLQYLYREFKSFDDDIITNRAKQLDPKTGIKQNAVCDFDPVTEELLRDVVKFYSQLSAGQLVDLSHVTGGPWHQVWNHDGDVQPGMKIENKDILEFYSKASAPFTIQ